MFDPMFEILGSILFFMTSVPPSAPGTQPVLAFPVECKVGQSCLIQKLVDHDPGPERRDHRCGTLTTDGHDGVDIRLRTMADMRKGYAVVAAHGGTVLRIRDGEPDISVSERTGLNGKDAGNAVVIDHGDGWQTQYSHLRRGSVRVRPGQRVVAGEKIGLVGLSGNSEFPHLHFAVRHQDVVVDPFMGSGPVAPCNRAPSAAGLWSPTTVRMLAYEPTAIIAAGLAFEVPPKSVVDRDPPAALAGAHAPLILWVDAIGARAGDRQEFSIVGPKGQIVHRQRSDVAGGGLSWFVYSGKRAPATGWQTGRYVGHYVLRRGDTIVAQVETSDLIE